MYNTQEQEVKVLIKLFLPLQVIDFRVPACSYNAEFDVIQTRNRHKRWNARKTHLRSKRHNYLLWEKNY